MDENLLSPYVRVSMLSVLPQGHILKTRVIYDYEIILIGGGSCKIIVDGKEYSCRKNDVIFFRPGVRHSIIVDKDADLEQPHIHFDAVYTEDSGIVNVSFKDISEMTPYEASLIRTDIFKGIPIPPVFVPQNMPAFRKAFFSVINLFNSNDRDVLKIKAEMLTLISLLLRQFSDKKNEIPKDSDRIIGLIKEYIDSNYMNVISLDSISELFSVNKFTALRKFKEKYGLTVIAYYNEKRLDAAKNLLDVTSLSVGEISDALSFSDEYTFSRFFKNKIGISPNSYRRNKTLTDEA